MTFENQIKTYTAPQDIEPRWLDVQNWLADNLGEAPANTESLLLMIGLREMGWTISDYSKQEKQDLIQLGTFSIMVEGGYYRKTHFDEQGWPQFELTNPLPLFDPFGQSLFIKERLVCYFESLQNSNH